MSQPPTLQDKVLEISGQYLFAGVQKTYLELGLASYLSIEKSAREAAAETSSDREATERFLNAAAFAGLVAKSDSGSFRHVPNAPHYTTFRLETLFWVVRNGVVDLLQSAGRLRAEQIVTRLREPNESYLREAESIGVLTRFGDELGVSAEAITLLASTSAQSLAPRLIHFEKVMFPMFDRALTNAVRTGKSQWQAVFGAKVTNPFTLYRKEPELLETFMRGMRQLNVTDDRVHAEALAQANPRRALDIGGGSGAFALQLIEAAPTLETIHVYELPDAIPTLSKILADHAPRGHRVEFVPGSFLAESERGLEGLEDTAQYDLIVLGWILHDWNDETGKRILKRARHHLAPGGRLAILELLLPENRVGRAALIDMAMLLQTEGKERTFRELERLLVESGYSRIRLVNKDTRRQLLVAESSDRQSKN